MMSNTITPDNTKERRGAFNWQLIQPIQDYIVVSPVVEEVFNENGIAMPDSYKITNIAKVLKVGPWCEGVNLPGDIDINNIVRCKPGDYVIYQPLGHTEFNEGFPSYHVLLLRASAIKAFVEEPKIALLDPSIARA